MRCVLVGNYGVGNIGDEALREYFLNAFPEIEWITVTASPRSPNDVPRLPLGVRSFFSRWWRTILAIRSADVLVFGGGSLFTDIESVWACLIWRSYASVAVLFGTPYFLAFQGVGPWKTALGKRLARKTYRFASFISVRDEASFRRVWELSPSAVPVLSFDPAFARFAESQSASSRTGNLLIIPRANSTEEFYDAVSRESAKHSGSVQVLLLEPQCEKRAADRIRRMLPECSIVEITSVSQLLSCVAGGGSVLAQRYHGALAALALSVPVTIIPQEAGDKLATLRDRILASGSQKEHWLSLVASGRAAMAKALAALP